MSRCQAIPAGLRKSIAHATLGMAAAIGFLSTPPTVAAADKDGCSNVPSSRGFRLAVRATAPRSAVNPKCRWNWAGVRVQPGEAYEIEVVVIEPLRDDDLEADPENGVTEWGDKGWMDSGYLDFLKRFPAENWFVLIGSVDKVHDFKVGGGNTWEAENQGELSFYVNDARGGFFVDWAWRNNSGLLGIRVRRIR